MINDMIDVKCDTWRYMKIQNDTSWQRVVGLNNDNFKMISGKLKEYMLITEDARWYMLIYYDQYK